MATVDILPIQIALRNPTPGTDRKLIGRIAKRPSKKPKTSGLAYLEYEAYPVQLQTDNEMYEIGQVQGGGARRFIKLFGNKGLREVDMGRHA